MMVLLLVNLVILFVLPVRIVRHVQLAVFLIIDTLRISTVSV